MKSEKYIFNVRLFIIIAILLLTIVTFKAVLDYGVIGIFLNLFSNSASIQAFTDLAISLLIILVWMWFDAKKHNRKYYIWLLITLLLGVYGPLFYLLLRKKEEY